jgi:hypothetical protein
MTALDVCMLNFLAERILKKAIEEGSFETPSRPGESLNLEENPFQDPAHRLTFIIFKNAGYRPRWLELEIEIREALAKARMDMLEASKLWELDEDKGLSAQDDFYHRLEEINQMIRELNFVVPLSRFQRAILIPEEELRRTLGKSPID